MAGVKGMKWQNSEQILTNSIGTSLSDEDFEKLKKIAKRDGLFVAQVARRAIQEYLKRVK